MANGRAKVAKQWPKYDKTYDKFRHIIVACLKGVRCAIKATKTCPKCDQTLAIFWAHYCHQSEGIKLYPKGYQNVPIM